MIRKPDGFEVVATGDEAAKLEMPPLLIVDRVTEFLDSHQLGSGPISWQRIGDGQSNITYLIEREAHPADDTGRTQFVLRRGPRPPIPKTTHDMIREATVQRKLNTVNGPVPQILAVADDESILGVPFYVMEYLDGVILINETPDIFDTPEGRRGASTALVDGLVELHTIDLEAAGLDSFGRPESYLERQVKTFAGLSTQVSQRDLPLVKEVGVWLEQNRPQTQRPALVHGDYRFGNVMFHPSAPPRLRAILDWEMATLGDPLADLGYLVATYADAAAPATVMSRSEVTLEEGYLSREEIVNRYAEKTGLDVSPLPWYQTLALWKASVFLEEIYTRWRAGERPNDTLSAGLEHAIPHLLEVAHDLTR